MKKTKNTKNDTSMWIAYAAMWIAVSAAVIAAMFITKSDIDIFFLLIPAFCGKKFKFSS